MTVIPSGIERCVCGHSILNHWLKEDSDEHGGCIERGCGCLEYQAAREQKAQAEK